MTFCDFSVAMEVCYKESISVPRICSTHIPSHMSQSASNSQDIHPFLKGNFAPVDKEFISYPCRVQGEIPDELLGGQYIRNGGNPVYPPDQGRHYHW
jgi:carotenoid cleavage dioxygenase-like enzyme